MARSSIKTVETVTMLLDELLYIAAEHETNDVARAVFGLMERVGQRYPKDMSLRMALLDAGIKAHAQALSKPSGDVLAQDAALWMAHLQAGSQQDDEETPLPF